jgi:DNA-binding MarR family transcriptional regulator
MQAITRPRADEGLDALAGAFEQHWEEMIHFITSRRFKSSVYRGAAGELSQVQLGALMILARQDLRMSDLAARLGLPESTTTRLVDRLEGARLVKREASFPDRRCVVAGLTAQGRRLIQRVRQDRQEFLKAILETLPRGERTELVRLFGRMAEELRARDLVGAGS